MKTNEDLDDLSTSVADDWSGDDRQTMLLIIRVLAKLDREARPRVWKAVGVLNGWLSNA